MIVLISGATHTGKTALAQKLLEKYGIPYLSMDHLKMGLIRSKKTSLTPEDSDEELTKLLWPIVREMIKTAIENGQSLIVEGCYIPFDWRKDFQDDYLKYIRAVWLVMSENYIREKFDDIRRYACVIEQRLDDEYVSLELLLQDNMRVVERCKENGCEYILIDSSYDINFEL